MKWFALLALAPLALFAVAPRVDVGRFSDGRLDGWETKKFHGETRYTLMDSEGRRVLAAESRASASGLYKKMRIDLAQTPYLYWSWKIEHTFGERVDETTKAGDDYPARVYMVFSGGVLFWRTQALNYVWASNRPEGSNWPNAYTANAHMLAVRSGGARAGQWVHERRDVRADYRRLFGGDVRYVDAVALMTDTDNTGGMAKAYYGDIYFAAE